MIIRKVTTTKVYIVLEEHEIAPDILRYNLMNEKIKRVLVKNICKKCGTIFYTRKGKEGAFCSLECKSVGRTESFSCRNCGNKVTRYKRFVEKNKTGDYFCSRECQTTFYRNKNKKGASCKECGIRIKNRHNEYFCSRECYERDKKRKIEAEKERDLGKWKSGNAPGNDRSFSIKKFVREYLLDKSNNKCSKCGWGEVSPFTGNVPLQIHHIDGNANNTVESNLEVLCPNCHSLTDNYGSRNKESVRVNRRINR